MQLAALRPLIQRLNVLQPIFKPITVQIDFALRDRVEHERIVRVGRMPKCKGFSGILCHSEFVIQTVFAFGSDTKRCVPQFTHSRAELDEFGCSRLSVRGVGEGRHARLGMGASHSEAATVQTEQPPRGFRAAAECI